MRGLLIMAVVLAVVIFLLPVLLGLALFLICAVIVFMLLARLGLIPGVAYRRYTFDPRTGRVTPPSEQKNEPSSRAPGGWYQGEQDGEIITLPEEALKKEETDA